MLFSYAAGLAALALGTAHAQSTNTSTSSLTDVLAAHANLSSFQALLQGQFGNLLNTLESFDATSNPVTILAPNNHAFDGIVYNDQLSPAFANNDTAYISHVIAYHTLLGQWTSQTLNTSFNFMPSMTQGTNFSMVTGGQRVGGVLQPGDKNTSSYEWEIVFTSGDSTRSVVTVQDIPFKGGFVQIIDNFLIPPEDFVTTTENYNLANYDNAITSFLGAVYSLNQSTSNLAKYLNETKDVTIFVPVNVAIASVSDTLLHYHKTPQPDLLNLLEYHIVLPPSPTSGPIYSSNFGNATQLTTMTNQSLEMRFFPNSYFVNQARIVASDIMIYNGVMHIIDGVLSPDQGNAVPNPTSATQAAVLPTNAGKVNGSEVPFTTDMPNFVPTETLGATSTIDFYARSSQTHDASATSSSKSIAGRTVAVDWTGLGVLGGWMTLAMASAVVFLV